MMLTISADGRPDKDDADNISIKPKHGNSKSYTSTAQANAELKANAEINYVRASAGSRDGRV
jgi:hypothetical protein